LINQVRNNPILTLNITVVSCYLIYFVAEYVDLGIKISGIMALVSLGLYMAAFGKAKISPDAH
jgi:asparagine N-glycosylation enzyme membrane subunit Stt3